MQTDNKPAPTPNGHTWTDEGGLPRATNGAYDPLTGAVKPDAPAIELKPQTVNPTEQAAADWRKHRADGADLVSLRSNFSKSADFLALRMYDNTIAQLRYPTPTRAQTSRNWRQPARKAA